MALPRLILLLSVICVGCPAKVPDRRATDDHPEAIRVRLSDARLASDVERALIAAPPPFGPGQTDVRGCVRYPRAVAAESLVESWQAELRRQESDVVWLLRPVVGAGEVTLGATPRARGLSAGPDGLVVCFDRDAPDWEARLSHPGLWSVEDDPTSFVRAPGEESFLVRDDARGARSRFIDRVEIRVADGSDPFHADRFDVALLYGKEADAVDEGRGSAFRLERIASWDVVYALWADGRERWTQDPSFRRWLAAVLDRPSTARVLFGERGEVASGLVAATALGPAPDRRPFSSATSPALLLAYDHADPHAASLAARLKAELQPHGLRVRLVSSGASADPPSLTLLRHRPRTADPLLALVETVWPVRGSAAEELSRLERATRIADPVRRLERARELEREMIADGRLVPLVRVHAWLAWRRGLDGVAASAYGRLELDRAEWR